MFWSAEEEIPLVKPITVDVGGAKHFTSRETICCKSVFFKKLLERADKALGREVESIFIDRDPKWFGTIVNYMRTGKLLIDGNQISDVAIEELALEAQFYRLPNLVNVISRLRELRAQTRKNRLLDPDFPFFGYHAEGEAPKAYCRLFYRSPVSTALCIEPFPLPVVSQLDMTSFTKAFTASFEATLNELIALGFHVEKLEWNEADGHRSYAVLSIAYV